MALVQVPAARFVFEDRPTGLEITIPAKKNWFQILFTGFWMVGWVFGEVFAVRQVFASDTPVFANLFLLAWLGGWTVGGAFIGYSWLWTLVGKERVVLRPGTLVTKRDVLGLGAEREYDLTHVRNLRVSPASYNPFDFKSAAEFWGKKRGPPAL